MQIMTPREYFSLLYNSFFKAITLTEEEKTWTKKKRLQTAIQAGVYNLLLTIIIFIIFILGAKIISILFSFNFGLSLNSTLSSIVVILFLVIFSVVIGVIFGFASVAGVVGAVVGIVVSIVVSVVVGGVGVGVVVGGVGVGGCVGVISSIKVVSRVNVLSGIVGGFIIIIGTIFIDIIVSGFSILSITTAIIFYEICFFIFFGRLFYYPFYLPGLFKKINLKRIPFHWDENIALPIPLLSPILVKQATYDKKAPVEEALLLIRTRKIHRKNAQKALATIAILEMKSFRNLENIARLKKELSFLPLSGDVFIDDFNKPFLGILEMEKDARITWEEDNSADKLRLLHRLHNKILDFRKEMDFSKSKYSLLFGEVALVWKEIVEMEIKHLEDTKGKPLPNPFITGNPIRPQDAELFMGRMDIIKEIEKEVLKTGSPGALLFLGNRRTGKTSTLLNMGPHLVSGIIPVFIDFQDAMINSSIQDFSSEMAERIGKAVRGKIKTPAHCTTLAELTGFMKEIQAGLDKTKQYILLCFDEYERIPGKNNELITLPDTFRYWIQHLPRFICLFAGSHRFNEIDRVDWSDYLISVRVIPISFLDIESARKLVTRPVSGYDIAYETTELAEKLIYRLGRQPYLIQTTMFELTELLNNKGSKTAVSEDIDAAVQKMFITADSHFSNFWQSELTPEEQDVVRTLAHKKRLPLNPETTLKALIRKEVFYKENDTYRFCIPVVKEWILSNT